MGGPTLELKTQALFSSFIFTASLKQSAASNHEIEKTCYDLKKLDSGLDVSNLGGWHSKTDLFLRKEKSLKVLCDEIITFAQQCTLKVNPKIKFENYTQEANGWININPPNGMNVPHDHPDWEMSGTYYVKVPQTSVASDGALELLDPRVNSWLSHIYSGNGLERKFLVAPKPGMIISFPSYLRHWVRPNRSNSDRISIAWNYRLKPNR